MLLDLFMSRLEIDCYCLISDNNYVGASFFCF